MSVSNSYNNPVVKALTGSGYNKSKRMELQKEGTTKEGNYAIQNHQIRKRTPEKGQRRKNMDVKKTTDKPVRD